MASVPPPPPQGRIVVKPEPRRDEVVIKPEPGRDEVVIKPEPGRDEVVIKPEPEPDAPYDRAYESDGTEYADPDAGYDSDRTENPYGDRYPEERDEKPKQTPPPPPPPWANPPPPPAKRERGRPTPRRPWADDVIHGNRRVDPLSDERIPRLERTEPDSAQRQKPHQPAARRAPKARKASQAQDNHDFLVCARNYAAVDARRESYGLIDQGLVDAGTRTMIMHVRRGQPAWDILTTVKPGSILAARSKSGRGSPTPLRVRFTTPTKYYSPGCKFTTLTVGVDEMDWQSLMAKARRI